MSTPYYGENAAARLWRPDNQPTQWKEVFDRAKKIPASMPEGWWPECATLSHGSGDAMVSIGVGVTTFDSVTHALDMARKSIWDALEDRRLNPDKYKSTPIKGYQGHEFDFNGHRCAKCTARRYEIDDALAPKECTGSDEWRTAWKRAEMMEKERDQAQAAERLVAQLRDASGRVSRGAWTVNQFIGAVGFWLREHDKNRVESTWPVDKEPSHAWAPHLNDAQRAAETTKTEKSAPQKLIARHEAEARALVVCAQAQAGADRERIGRELADRQFGGEPIDTWIQYSNKAGSDLSEASLAKAIKVIKRHLARSENTITHSPTSDAYVTIGKQRGVINPQIERALDSAKKEARDEHAGRVLTRVFDRL